MWGCGFSIITAPIDVTDTVDAAQPQHVTAVQPQQRWTDQALSCNSWKDRSLKTGGLCPCGRVDGNWPEESPVLTPRAEALNRIRRRPQSEIARLSVRPPHPLRPWDDRVIRRWVSSDAARREQPVELSLSVPVFRWACASVSDFQGS